MEIHNWIKFTNYGLQTISWQCPAPHPINNSTSHFDVTRRVAPLLATSIFPFDMTRRAECLLAMSISWLGGLHPSLPRQFSPSTWLGGLSASLPCQFSPSMWLGGLQPSLPCQILVSTTRDAILVSYSHQCDEGETPHCVIFILSNAMREFPPWCVRYLVNFYVFSSKIIQNNI